jgi:hypothetical protein
MPSLSTIIGWFVLIVVVIWAFKHPETVSHAFSSIGHAISVWTSSA